MKNKNILILSAGRRVKLIQNFKNDVQLFPDDIQVYCTDLNPAMSSACQVADAAFAVPRIDDNHYIEHILQLAQQQNIGLIIPTIDTELIKLADARARFAALGIDIVISDAHLVRQCRDKRQTVALFQQYQINSPRIYAINEIEDPCFVKPYDDSRAIGAQIVNGVDELTEELQNNPKMMFCQLIDIEHTFKEYTVDLYDRKAYSNVWCHANA